ncbi:MAG: T9SS type A sorting domain-containing protein [Ignavibacteria bacterium]|nr:T9SS type A sorting domain-containing protein [Ignavibacteria bacterium]
MQVSRHTIQQIISDMQLHLYRIALIILTAVCVQGIRAQVPSKVSTTPRLDNRYNENVTRRALDSSSSRASEINISNDPSPQNEPFVKISRKNTNRVVAAWRDFRTGISPAIRRIGYSHSTDGGRTWAPSSLLRQFDPLHPRASDPCVTVDTDGNFYIATISLDERNLDGKVLVFRSTDQGVSFDTAFTASPAGSGGEDRDYIACDVSQSSPFRNTLYACWTRIHPSGGILLARSSDRAQTWSVPVRVSSDTSRSVGGSSLAIGPHGELYLVWIGANGVWLSRSRDGGISFGNPISISGYVERGAGWPSIAVDISSAQRRGFVYVTWEDFRNGDLDIFLAHSSDGGEQWSTPQRINSDPTQNGRDQFLTSIAVDDSGYIHVLFYDTRDGPDGSYVRAYIAVSEDGGNTFDERAIGTEMFRPSAPNSAVRFGDYISIDSWGGKTVAVWMDQRLGGWNQEIFAAVSNRIPDSTSDEHLLTQTTLRQNYSNPFSWRTIISFFLSIESNATLKIFDLLGREVETLVDTQLPPGHHSFEWTPQHLAAGIYFYRLQTPTKTITQTCLLLR